MIFNNIRKYCYHSKVLLAGEGTKEGGGLELGAKKLKSYFRVLSVQISLVFQKNYLTDAGNLSIILNVEEVKIKQSKSEYSAYTNC